MGTVSDRGLGHASLSGAATTACSCPRGPGASCAYVVNNQDIYANETLSARSGTVTIKSTGKGVQAFTCKIPGKASAVVYPSGMTFGQSATAQVAVLQLKTGSTSCQVTQGSWQPGTKKNAVFFAGNTAITVRSLTAKNVTRGRRMTASIVTVGSRQITVKGNPVFGMTRTRRGTTAGTLVQIATGRVYVGGGDAGASKPVARQQQAFVPDAHPTVAVSGYTQPAAVLKPALCALTPDLRETNTVKFAGGAERSHPLGLANDLAGNIWFTDDGIKAIGKYDITAHAISYDRNGLSAGSSPTWIATGPNGTIWFTDVGSGTEPRTAIGMLDPKSTDAGTGLPKITEIPVPGSDRKPWAIAYDPKDGRLWFTDPSQSKRDPALGAIDPKTLKVTLYRAGFSAGSQPEGIAIDTKGRVWFTDDNNPHPAIGMLDPSAAHPRVTEWPTGIPGSLPRGLTAGSAPDTHLYFADERTVLTNGLSTKDGAGDGLIGVIDPASATPKIAEYSVAQNGGNGSSVPEGLAPDAHGNIWFTDDGAVKTIGMIDPITGAITEADQSSNGMTGSSAPIGILLITQGPAQGLWFTDQLPSPRVGEIAASPSC